MPSSATSPATVSCAATNRPRCDDGLPAGEGVFLACSFWLVEALLGAGRHHEAHELFERLLALRNDVGLLSEEWTVQDGRLLGNSPQAFSHFALVVSALELQEAGVRRSDTPAPGPLTHGLNAVKIESKDQPVFVNSLDKYTY